MMLGKGSSSETPAMIRRLRPSPTLTGEKEPRLENCLGEVGTIRFGARSGERSYCLVKK
jgi:hypothetical protein